MQKELFSVIEGIIEQRRKPRFQGSFPAMIRGIDDSGRMFEAEALVENISACGLYLSTSRFFLPDKPISVAIQLGGLLSNAGVQKTYLETDGMTVRVDSLGQERYGVAVEIQRYSFL